MLSSAEITLFPDMSGLNPFIEENLQATLLISMRENKIGKMTMCGISSPHECRRTGESPV